MSRFTFLFAFLIVSSIFAQDKGSISGKIIDLEMNNEPMLLANVQLKGQSEKVQTNFHGNFELKNIIAGDYTLVISYAGYNKLEIPVQVEKNKISEVQCGLSHKTIPLDHYVDIMDKTELSVGGASTSLK